MRDIWNRSEWEFLADEWVHGAGDIELYEAADARTVEQTQSAG
jgi:hypothetical protein